MDSALDFCSPQKLNKQLKVISVILKNRWLRFSRTLENFLNGNVKAKEIQYILYTLY